MLDEITKKFVRNVKWYDFGFLKLAIFFFTLFLFTAWPAFRDFVLGFDWYWYLIIAILFMIPLFKKEFTD